MATQWLKNLSHKAANVKMLGSVYNASLGKPDELLDFTSYPPDLFGGDAGRGRWIASGQIDCNGHRLPLDLNHWFVGTAEQTTPFFEKLHGFDFLLELKALGGEVGRRSSRDITQSWLDQFQNYDPIVWEADLTAKRIVNWLITYSYAFESATDEFLLKFHHSFYRQYHHLEQTLLSKNNLHPFDRFSCLWGLLIAQCHCTNLHDDVAFKTYLQLIKGVVEDVSLPDGGIIDHNLENVMEMAKSLILLRQSLQMKSQTIPLWLPKSIENFTKIMHNLCHGDGDFPQFQKVTLPHKKDLEKTTKQSGFRLRRHNFCYPDMGYTVMRHGRTTVIVDHIASGDHCAPLAFEMSYAGHRLITSCGHYCLDDQWSQGLALLPAHSGLMIEGSEPQYPIDTINASLETLNGASLFCGSHEGYAKQFDAFTHTRRLYVDHDGEDIRGEDLLTRNVALKTLPIIARFHLPSGVKASLIEDHMSVLLRLNSGVGWVFRAEKGQIELEESVSCQDGMNIRKTQQITVRFPMDDLSLQIKWAIKKQ